MLSQMPLKFTIFSLKLSQLAYRKRSAVSPHDQRNHCHHNWLHECPFVKAGQSTDINNWNLITAKYKLITLYKYL